MKQKRGYFMVDSTYLVASDPNSMRDTGPLRNAVYSVKDSVDDDYAMRTT